MIIRKYFIAVTIAMLIMHDHNAQVIIIGGGASGTTAALQAARMGVEVEVFEETSWLGGMLTSAGVSAIDGNHNLPSGIWGEFREKLYRHYGGADAVNTGWVSNTLFEPHVGNKILNEMVTAEENITVHFNTEWHDIKFVENRWVISFKQHGKVKTTEAVILIDATELGDVGSVLNYPYYVGMDSQDRFEELQAPAVSNAYVQDLTFVAILKDYGRGRDRTIPRPKNYNPELFRCACSHADPIVDEKPKIDCEKMLSYGRLPNNKYMINWPNCGNDYYLNIIELAKVDREAALESAKQHTLQFIYFIQHELGYSHLGLADDEFPTRDKLPIIPYHRESRRFKTEVALSLPYLSDPYHQNKHLYRTGIAVGDYPIDHHHKKNTQAPEIDFIKIRIPAYNIPLGALVPKGSTHLIIAEKSIGVSNIVNGATRLQPVVLGIGQATGALAAIAIQKKLTLQEVNIRAVQEALLNNGAYLMPYIDVTKTDSFFKAVQRIGATGIMQGEGVPYLWANQTWFYPYRELSEFELVEGLKSYYEKLKNYWSATGEPLSIDFLKEVVVMIDPSCDLAKIENRFKEFNSVGRKVNRWQTAVLLDEFLNPFDIRIDWNGTIMD
jgi:hypothetical protein